LLISFIAAKSVVEGNITLGMLMSVSYIIGQLSGPISQVIGFVQSAQDARISLERLNEIQNRDDEHIGIEHKRIQIPTNKSFYIKNLYFSYDGADRDYALKRINLQIPANKITAIVGTSGSGKTTLIKMLLGFYPPNKGTIKIEDVPLHDIHPYS